MDRRKFLTIAGVGAVGLAGSGVIGSQFIGGGNDDLGSGAAGGSSERRLADAIEQTGARSLVCIFLEGGADSANMFIPVDHAEIGKSYDVYRSTRGDFAVPAADILPYGDAEFGFNPGLPSLANLAEEQRLAVLQNVGPLAKPTTRADFEAGSSVPQTLFAHDAQQKLWQTASATLTPSQGWGGGLSTIVNADAVTAPAFSLNGSNIWQAAAAVPYTRLSPTVAIERFLGYDSSIRTATDRLESLESVLRLGRKSAASSDSVFERAIAETLELSILTTESLQEATLPSESAPLMADMEGNRLGLQLQQVARLIRSRDLLGMPRQIFFVRMNGWDTHGEQVERFPVLLAELDSAIASFQGALDELGVADSVTTFTASEFGRTLTRNGDGTDHGWGGHAFVFGGAVEAGRYGAFPSYSTTDNPDDTGDRRDNFAGRLIPTTAVCQYGATLASWMGLSDGQLDNVFPELANFEQRNLGFLKS